MLYKVQAPQKLDLPQEFFYKLITYWKSQHCFHSYPSHELNSCLLSLILINSQGNLYVMELLFLKSRVITKKKKMDIYLISKGNYYNLIGKKV